MNSTYFASARRYLLGIVALASVVVAQSILGRNLVWADEFSQSDGTSPDPAKWNYDIGGSGWGNNELQYYTNRTQNARIENGTLVIEACAENYSGKNYTSARLLTKGKQAWTYGRIEARIKIPKGQGIWPAFWMLGTNIDAVGWPNCGEIDIIENIGSLPSTLYGTVHGPGYSGGGGISGNTVLSEAALGDDFHVYAIEWEQNRIRWFLDGQLFFTVTPASLPAGSSWVFNQPQFLILNVAVGGNWPGSPNSSTVFPQRMTVDYVRVYESDSVTPPVDSNVLLDPGFETAGLPNWTTYGSNVYSETGTTHEGAKSLKIFGQFSGAANNSGAWQDVTAAPGDSFSADSWLFTPSNDKIAGANSAWIDVSFMDANNNILSLYRSAAMTSTSTAGVWQNFVVNTNINPLNGAVIGSVSKLVAPAGTVKVRKQVVFRQPASAGGSVWFDDMRLTDNTIVEPPVGTSVTVDPNETWLGYMNVFNLPTNGGDFQYGDVWNTADLKASFSSATLTLGPNSINNPDPYWYIGGGAPGRPGNKIMKASMYVEKTDTLAGQTVIFTGTVAENTLTSTHTSVAFIKDFSPDYSSHTVVSTPLVNGTFSISMKTNPGVGRHVQYGFQTVGVNVWSTDVAPFGTVKITALNKTPTLTEIANQTINEDQSTAELSFTVNDEDTAAAELIVTGTSSNTALIPDANILLGGSGANRTVTITPVSNQSGTATITLVVDDGTTTSENSFEVTVAAVNDAPTITTIADQTIATNSKSAALLVAIGDLDTLPGSLVITGSSSNSKLVPLSGIVISGSSAERSVTIQPAAGELGSATVTVTVSDGDLSAFTSFLVTVTGTALERWRYNHYGTTINAGQASDTIDSNSDGEPNLMEFTTGQNPAAHTRAATLLTKQVESIEFSYPLSLVAVSDGLDFTVESSETLTPLSWIPANVSREVVSGSGSTRIVTCTIPLGPETANFFRLKVTRH